VICTLATLADVERIRSLVTPHRLNRVAGRNGGTMNRIFAQFANWFAVASGHPMVFASAVATVIGWLATGPFFVFSDTWQLVMNTWTSVATFLMVFLIQNSQNRDSSAIQAKLDELIRTSAARNTLLGIEKLTPEEIETIRQSVERLARQRSEMRNIDG